MRLKKIAVQLKMTNQYSSIGNYFTLPHYCIFTALCQLVLQLSVNRWKSSL